MKIKFGYLCILVLTTLTGCVSYTSLVNFDEYPTIPTSAQAIQNYDPLIIKPGDILHIKVSSEDEVSAEPFQLSTNSNNIPIGGLALLISGYLVDQDGNINFPTLGQVKIGDLSTSEARTKMLELLQPYFNAPPIVSIRLLNFRVNVNGEVANPGTFDIPNERVTILEAITMAGDFTDYASRDSVLIVREAEGQRSFGFVSFNSSEIFNSPYFYLEQNDVIYVRPDRRKVGVVRDPAFRIFTWVSAITGTAALIISISRN